MEYNVTWKLSNSTTNLVTESLARNGIKVRQGLGIEPLTGLLIVLSIKIIINVIRDIYKDINYAGLIIDTTKSPIEIKDMPQWDRSQVLLITVSGADLVVFKNGKGDLDKLLKLLEQQ